MLALMEMQRALRRRCMPRKLLSKQGTQASAFPLSFFIFLTIANPLPIPMHVRPEPCGRLQAVQPHTRAAARADGVWLSASLPAAYAALDSRSSGASAELAPLPCGRSQLSEQLRRTPAWHAPVGWKANKRASGGEAGIEEQGHLACTKTGGAGGGEEAEEGDSGGAASPPAIKQRIV